MRFMNRVYKYSGVAAIPVYIAFTFASHTGNPEINPIDHWLSDYGNPLVNPSGAAAYNAGCVLTALLLAVFYVGMYRWYGRGRAARRFNISYFFAQTGGIMGSIFLILTTVYTLGTNTQMHSLFSLVNMVGMDFFLSFTATGFLLNPKIHKGVGIFGFVAAAFNIVTMNVFINFYISEWIFFALFMAYMVLITLQYDRILGSKTSSTPAGIGNLGA